MYVNNISERSSSRVLQQPGGRQTHNIFGGDDTPEPVQQRGVRRGPPQQSSQEPLPAPPQTQAPPAAQVSQVSQVAAGARKVESEQPIQRQARSVNNIWGNDEEVTQKPSTRVISRPGGDSSGVAGALGTEPQVEHKYRANAGRSNQTSDNSPFSSAPMPVTQSRSAANRAKQVSDNSPFSDQPAAVRSSTRVTHAPGGQSSNIISWQ